LAAFVSKVELDDLVKGRIRQTRIKLLKTPDELDAAIFLTAQETRAKPHALAAENPKVGDVIWLVASLQGQPATICHRATVVNVWDHKFKCKFDNGDLVTRGASGAPYVNAAGEVVGLHTGSYKDPGNVAGAAIPVENLRQAIDAALQK